jgi:hypothetical protein
MSRRALPVALAAAALVFVPSTASAEPAVAVAHFGGVSYSADAEFTLLDGRHVFANLSRHTLGGRQEWAGFLSIRVQPACMSDPEPCWGEGEWTGSTALRAEEVSFDRSLRTASVHDVTLTLSAPYDPDPAEDVPDEEPPGEDVPPWDGDEDVPSWDEVVPGDEVPGDEAGPGDEELPPSDGEFQWPDIPVLEEDITVSLEFTGTGTVTRSADHAYTWCGEGIASCQSNRLYANRTADAVVTLVWAGGHGDTGTSITSTLSYAQGVDAGRLRASATEE